MKATGKQKPGVERRVSKEMKGLMRWREMTWQLKAGLAVVVFLAILKFGLAPLYEWRGETLQSIERLKESVAVKKTLIGKKSGFQDLLGKAKSSFDEVLQSYYQEFTDPQSLQLILQKEMERLSSSCNVKIKTTEWLYASKEDVVQAPIKLLCEAPVDNIIRLIAAVETGRKFLSIDRLKIVSGPTSTLVRADIVMSAYGIKDGS